VKTIAIVPAFNEQTTIASVVSGLRNVVSEVLVIDDGSRDRTAELAVNAGAEVIAHATNRGLGAALTTGIAAALSRGADILVTFDADGQMDPADVPRLLSAISPERAARVEGLPYSVIARSRATLQSPSSKEVLDSARTISHPSRHPERSEGSPSPVIPSRAEGSRSSNRQLPNYSITQLPAAVSIGSRWLTSRRPFTRYAANLAANIFTYLLFGIWSTDTQSGLRAFTRQAAEQLELHPHAPPGMEVSSEIFAEIARLKLRFVEAPIQPRYTEYSKSKGQNFFVGLATLGRLFLRRLTR